MPVQKKNEKGLKVNWIYHNLKYYNKWPLIYHKLPITKTKILPPRCICNTTITPTKEI